MRNVRENKGITLVALVVTIIILIILAGISIAELTGNGLLSRAIEAKLEAKRSQISEWLNLKLVEEQSKHTQGTAEEIIEATRINIKYNQSELEELGKDIKIPENISTEENGKIVEAYFYVEVDKDVYKVCLEGVVFIGESGKLPPGIEITKITSTTNSITVEVTTTRNEGGKIEYYIKSEDETKYEHKVTITETMYTFTGLEQNKTYNIKIVAIAENGKKAEVTTTKTVGSVTEIKEGDIIFTFNPTGWTNGSVTVTAQVKEGIDITGYTLQTSKDGTNYTSTANQTFTTNGTIYARLIDSIGQYKGIATRDIEKIEKTAPTISLGANFNITYSKTQSVEVTLADSESGLANEISVKYGWSTSYTTEPTTYTTVKINSDGEKSKTFTAVGSGYTGQYYLWVVPITVKDAAGNSNETKVISSGAFAFDNTAPTITSLTKSDVNWSGSTGTVTLTASAKEKETQIIAYKFTTDGNITALSDNWSFITPPSSETTQTMDVSIGAVWYFYVSDKLGNISKTSIDLVPHPSYGTTIQSNYSNIYTSGNSQQAVNVTSSGEKYYAGNYNRMIGMLENIGNVFDRIDNGVQNNGSSLSCVYSGSNTNTFSSNVSNRWIIIRLRCSGYTYGVSVSNFKINFIDGTTLSIKEAVDNKYIEPLVLYQSASSSASYIWNNMANIITGGTTDVANYPGAYIILKAKDLPIKGVTFTTNKDWSEISDGLGVYRMKENYEFSIAPF